MVPYWICSFAKLAFSIATAGMFGGNTGFDEMRGQTGDSLAPHINHQCAAGAGERHPVMRRQSIIGTVTG